MQNTVEQDFELCKVHRVSKQTAKILVDLIVSGVGHFIKNPMLRNAKNKSISSDKNNFILLKASDQVIGFLMYRIDKELSFLYEIHIEEQFRKKGYGCKLMEEYFKDQPGKELILFVHKKNISAQAFYEKLEFLYDRTFEEKNYFKMTKKN
jgi:ribosomal protein S18 acetylase RimI-like enzyme